MVINVDLHHKCTTIVSHMQHESCTFIAHLCRMTVKEYLLTTTDINLAELARKMWPTNKNAKSYLSRKLVGDRPFTEKDAALARSALHDLGHKLIALE